LANILPQAIFVTRQLPELNILFKPFELPLPVPATLAQEFAAWDAASDEALINFECENL
jgi:hypothetical protein